MIDLLRGLVIVIMVLDHVRDFFHATAFIADPTDLSTTSPALFLTRWITHFCAPTFVFLAGVSAFLQGANGRSKAELTRFLLTRGLWLILLEVTLVNLFFNFGPFFFLQVIWAIGAGFLVLAALIWLPASAVLAIGALIVVGHNALAPIDAEDLGGLAPAWRLAMEPGLFGFMPGFIPYPFVPWLGILCLGYGLGFVFVKEAAARRRALLAMGAGAVALFLILRGINAYGDGAPWSGQKDALFTALSFINTSKYPPSLLYTLMTLGPAMLLLVALERLRGPAAAVLLTFGRTPLFTYLLHILVAHGLASLIAMAMGHPHDLLFNLLYDPSRAIAADWGFELPGVYLAWLAVLAILYPLSRWFAGVKRRRRDWWLGYL
jgi:uncharacterized membrane protein